MKICTVNIPIAYLKLINELIGSDGLYPSRSELVRVATREFLLKHLARAKLIIKNKNEEGTFDKENMVKVPIDRENGEFKTYKILRRLDG